MSPYQIKNVTKYSRNCWFCRANQYCKYTESEGVLDRVQRFDANFVETVNLVDCVCVSVKGFWQQSIATQITYKFIGIVYFEKTSERPQILWNESIVYEYVLCVNSFSLINTIKCVCLHWCRVKMRLWHVQYHVHIFTIEMTCACLCWNLITQA